MSSDQIVTPEVLEVTMASGSLLQENIVATPQASSQYHSFLMLGCASHFHPSIQSDMIQ